MDIRKSHERFWDVIGAKGAEGAAAHGGCRHEGGKILVPLVDRTYACDPAARTLVGPDGSPAGFLESVVLVTYLARADGTEVSGNWVSEKMLPLGDSYFRHSHAIPVEKILPPFADDEAAFRAAVARVGGTAVDYGDFGAQFQALPRVPMRLGIWRADEEFGADARMLFDDTAHVFLILDGLLTLVNVLFKRLLDG